MNTLLTPIFTDSTAELNNIQSSSPSIDFMDSPLPPSLIGPFITSPNFLVTSPVAQTGYYEIQFMLANSFWGCQFNFGNAPCGVQIRQGIAHMIDKNSFTTTEAAIGGHSAPIDNPVPTTSVGGLKSPNPCAYDASFPETNATTGNQCVIGSAGGTAYHLAPAAGANGIPWLPAPGSADLNAAAQHFVNAGIATGFNSLTSVLTGISSAAGSNQVVFFIRNDDVARLDLGNSLAEEICYMFTGSYSFPCPYLRPYPGPVVTFPGFTTSKTAVSLTWGMYTAAYSYVPSFDDSLYYTYNSRFVSGVPSIQPPNGPCSAQAVPTSTAANYMYLCSPTYDSISSQMEAAPSLSQAVNLGIQAEAYFGANAFTLPIFERTQIQFGYLNNGWVRDVNSNDEGLPNYFTWLNAYNPTATQAWTIRQGFSQQPQSVNPFIASSPQDLYIVNNVYDSLHQLNPLNPSQGIDWMTVLTQQLSNSSLTYVAPAHTLASYRFFLRSDMFFQDGKPVTAYDVAFSYLMMVASGAFLGTGALPLTGITILGPHQFDIGVNSLGPFVLPNLTGLPIVPGRYWTSVSSSAWDAAVSTCTSGVGCGMSQYTLAGQNPVCNSNAPFNCAAFPATLMTINSANTAATYDPIASHTFVGSGAWTCGTVTNNSSGTCTPSGTMTTNSFTLTRFGNGLAPASSLTGSYFRSSGDTALWIWSEQGGADSFVKFAAAASCYGQPVNLNGPCSHWQQGVGNPGTGSTVGVSQVAIANRFFNVNWISPFDWRTNPPLGIAPFPPVLYEGSITLNPSSVVGCPSGYDC
jgi:hypothetical protein